MPESAAGMLPASALATLPAAAQLDKEMLAAALGIKQRALEQRMAKKQLPAPFKLGRKCVWLAGHLNAWFENQAREAERRAKR